jgi:serine/threonine protein kinase/Tfp pilus assembly protein PilF
LKTADSVCGKCGAKIFADAPQNFCGACLLETGLGLLGEEDEDIADEKPMRRGSHGVRSITMLSDFGDYELLEEIGRGGQGVVYRAHQKSLNRTVALKVIGLGPWATEAHLKRFRREAEAAASLEHSGIVPIYEVGERDGSCYFSMKFVEGGELDELVKREPMPIRRAVELIAKVARTVHYAHEHRILHRDIKPGNILLDGKGEPHLTDFGLARLVETESTVTRTLEVLGTPSYMAPEQAAGNKAKLTSATDVYGLGAVLYQLLTGHPPFAGGTTYETIRLLLETEPRQPRQLNPKIDRDLSTICLKCIEKDPKRRYPSALALAEDLDRWLKHEPIRARRTGVLTRGKKWVRRNPTTTVLTASLAALAVVIGTMIWKTGAVHPVPAGIAVLPFENLSSDKENAFFADGIQEEILTRLAQISALKVISGTSTQRYQSKPGNLSEIARQLGVANILEGSVRRSADQVRVNVQLIKAANGTRLWTDTFDRKVSDIFAVESEIAKAVAHTLKAKLSGAEQSAITPRPTENSEAHELYLRGRYFFGKRRGDFGSLRRAIDYFNQAIGKDPNYAVAYAGLAECYVVLPGQPHRIPIPPAELVSKAKAAAERALALDNTLAEAHCSLGLLLVAYEGNLRESRREFERAIELNPNYADAHYFLGYYVLKPLGDFDHAIAEFKRAVELDPFSLTINANFGLCYFIARRYPEAIAQAHKAAQMDPSSPTPYITLAAAHEFSGQRGWAIADWQKACEVVQQAHLARAWADDLCIQSYVLKGDQPKALQLLDEIIPLAQRGEFEAFRVARIYNRLGDKNKIIEWLERSYQNKEFTYLLDINVLPAFDSLRGDPRFEKLADQVIPPDVRYSATLK